ncbi:DUF2946 family protein [Pseudoduganella namucuonensis]|uniref:DUF2946 family protein n=1 Tax=Pseudoduganella namucuonensis TaxID=1035707 RepID=A0A1I7KKB7_9BURK|nr:DUF2946 family protein [Pseudoduganella namucuonensis]SFU97870.1 Protein of unknown function [Pseudoduganella namucuonensis]
MDDIVKQAMAKWPNVPNCYGWLGLDARGNWRMRDERAQQLGLAGDKLSNPALVGFIVRNYGSDERGCWYFQNGPQRVYLNLETTPFVARTDPAAGFALHTGAAFAPEAAWLTEAGELVLRQGDTVAQLDDRDMAQAMERLEIGGRPAGDDALLAWLSAADATRGQTPDRTAPATDAAPNRGLSPVSAPLVLRAGGRDIPVQHLRSEDIPSRFNFQRLPAA